jgi:aminoglycoside phosphotransferase
MIDDAVLPAAAHLTGPYASDVVGAAVRAAGSELLTCRPVQVQYRPGSDLIVRYRATLRLHDGSVANETLLAGVTRHGPHQGTLPVEADTESGTNLVAGVWRWPFDPVLTELDRIVSPARAADELAGLVHGRVHVDVVVYRPCERVVARITDAAGHQIYVKLVAPAAVAPLAERHRRLREAGVPAPAVLQTGHSWIAMESLAGPTLRDVLKADGSIDRSQLPAAAHLAELSAAIGTADLGHLRPVRRRLDDAVAHASMLATVHTDEADRLHRLADTARRESLATASRCGAVIHSDLHEGQLIVRDGAVVGVLDVDDAGPGDPFDDAATLVGHLRYRAIVTADRADELTRYADEVRRAACEHLDAGALDVATGAVLVGLATGPFRIQQSRWQESVTKVLDVAEAHLDRSCTDEKSLSEASSPSHVGVAS